MNRLKRIAQIVSQLKSGFVSLFLVMFLMPADLVWSVPLELTYQGRVYLADAPFEGVGSFKFALLDEDGASVWSNDGSSVAGSEPAGGVALPVTRGSYAIRLGDESLSGMEPISAGVFDAEALFLRIWFKAGSNPFALLTPDRALGSVAFSIKAASADYATIAGTVETLPEINATDITSGTMSDARIGSDIARVSALTSQVAALQSQIDALAGQSGLTTSVSIVVASKDASDSALLAAGYRRFSTLSSDGWANGSSDGQPGGRSGHASVWTGNHLIVWGGEVASSVFSNTGGIYNTAADSWTAVSNLDAPSARARHSAVWTGSEMLVWGGLNGGGYLADGKRFDPDTQLWTPMGSTNVPSARAGQITIWTGEKLVVWGGINGDGLLADGAIYDPDANLWAALPTSGAPAARQAAAAGWTGSEIVIFGGTGIGGDLANGAQLNFSGGNPTTWQALSTTNAPTARSGHSAVWDGENVLIFGGEGAGSALGDGFAYDPTGNSWSALSNDSAPSARAGHSAVWTGSELVVFGGETVSGATSDGFAYDPESDSWRSVSGGSPLARTEAIAHWTGDELIIFGGKDGAARLSSLQRIDANPTLHLFRAP